MAEKFAVNDYVIYGKSGLCFVKEIKKMRMANGPLSEYYILNSATGNAVTIYVQDMCKHTPSNINISLCSKNISHTHFSP